MIYPKMEEYTEVMQYPHLSLSDNELKNGIVKKSGYGIPIPVTGGFALTYTVECSTKKYAVRCFHRPAPNIEEKYTKISSQLKKLSKEFFVDFDYQAQGICINGKHYPIVKMEWAEGVTLGEFFENNFNNNASLTNLSISLLNLSQYLEKNKIAHGDIQTGNVMVSNDGKMIKLIDYDGLYLESLKNLGSSETGHVNFQHPLRQKLNPYNERIDRFSLIVVWLATISLIEDSNLWKKTKSDFDNFVFRANDFISPASSQTFGLLTSYPRLKKFIADFASICNSNNLDQIPSLFNFVQGNSSFVPTTITTREFTGTIDVTSYISPYPVIDATNFAACVDQIGNLVEVIGQITYVKEGTATNGSPYIFINFGDWRKKIFKVAIWGEGINTLNEKPNYRWKGKWVSIKGLMDKPYTGKKQDGSLYTNISITVSKKGQMNVIDKQEATLRLNAYQSRPSFEEVIATPEPTKPKDNNTNILAELRRIQEEKRQADLRAKQKAEEEKRQADLRAKQKAEEEKRQADLRARQKAEEEKRQADLRARQKAEEEKRQADLRARQKSNQLKLAIVSLITVLVLGTIIYTLFKQNNVSESTHSNTYFNNTSEITKQVSKNVSYSSTKSKNQNSEYKGDASTLDLHMNEKPETDLINKDIKKSAAVKNVTKTIPEPKSEVVIGKPKPVVEKSVAPTLSSNGQINAKQASQHIGERATVCGQVAQVKEFSKGYYLNLGNTYPHQDATVLVWSSNVDKFDNLTSFEGSPICVDGMINTYKGVPQIEMKSPSQINN